MSPSVFAKTLHDHRKALVWWALGLAGVVGLEVAFYPSIKEQAGLQDAWRNMPDSLKALFGLGRDLDLTSAAGYLKAELLGFTLPLCLLIFSIASGGGAVAGEEERGTLDLLLAQPISRRSVVVQKYMAIATMTLGLSAVVLAVLVVARPLATLDVPVLGLAAAVAGVASLGLLFGAVALLIGCHRGQKAPASAVPAALALALFLLDSFGAVTRLVKPVGVVSPFRWSLGGDPLRHGFHPSMLLTPAACIIVLWAAWVAFERRDLH